MEAIDGVWYCASFLGDSFELTTLSDGALMFHTLRKRFRRRGMGLRLEAHGGFCWEAEHQIRLWRCGKSLSMQHYQKGKGKWGPEVQAFREGLAATGNYFQGFFRKDDTSKGSLLVKRESSTVFKVVPFSPEAAFGASQNPISANVEDESDDSDVEGIDEIKEMRLKHMHDSEPQECKICMESDADVMLIPCGHSGMCEQCVSKLSAAKKAVSCPFCRAPVQKVAKIDTQASRVLLTDDDCTLCHRLLTESLRKDRPPRQAWPWHDRHADVA